MQTVLITSTDSQVAPLPDGNTPASSEKKPLIFLDNDSPENAKTTSDYAWQALKQGGLTSDYLRTMQTMTHIAQTDLNDLLDQLFTGSYCITTWAMYTENHHGSLYQIVQALEQAGLREVKDILYCDCSGQLPESLSSYLNRCVDTHVVAVLKAIETNFILTCCDMQWGRMRVDLTQSEGLFRLDPVQLTDYLQ